MGLHVQSEKYDVIILGGGLSGLTLALQLKLKIPSVSILVLDKRKVEAPVASHKVGESIVELGSYYLREVLLLKEYLDYAQLPKLGFRFFFSHGKNEDLAKRVEMGSKIPDPFPAHQIDRGTFENELLKIVREKGVIIKMGSTIKGLNISKSGHLAKYEKGGNVYFGFGKWIIDASGRSGILKRKLDLVQETDHNINASWFRIKAQIDIQEWSDDALWKHRIEPGKRRLATNHLMGRGYWIWIIPLISGHTSIGVVTDPRYHKFESVNTFSKALRWFKKNEPLAARELRPFKDRVIDFKLMKKCSVDIKQFYSSDRWGVTGDAGTFLDPFYSPGTDFIALGNSWLTELIDLDLKGKNIDALARIFDYSHREMLKGWITLYKDMYGIFGHTQIMLMKIIWDWSAYWGITSLMFINKGYTQIKVLKEYSSGTNSLGRKFSRLNENMQYLFQSWAKKETPLIEDQHINVFDLKFLYEFHLDLSDKYDPDGLLMKIKMNLQKLELIGTEIFKLVYCFVHGTSLDIRIDPYNMTLDQKAPISQENSLHDDLRDIQETIRADIGKLWFIKSVSQV